MTRSCLLCLFHPNGELVSNEHSWRLCSAFISPQCRRSLLAPVYFLIENSGLQWQSNLFQLQRRRAAGIPFDKTKSESFRRRNFLSCTRVSMWRHILDSRIKKKRHREWVKQYAECLLGAENWMSFLSLVHPGCHACKCHSPHLIQYRICSMYRIGITCFAQLMCENVSQ